MPLHGPRAEEQATAYLGIRQPLAGEARNLDFLRRHVVAALGAALAHAFSRCDQLAPRPLRERVRSHLGEQRVCRAQLLARVLAPALAAQLLSVEEMCAGEIRS